MSGYGQFCPVAQALQVVGERWPLLIMRELLCGDYRFGERSREGAGLVERRGAAATGCGGSGRTWSCA